MLRAAHTLSACAAAVALSACSPSGQVSDSGFGAYEVSLATWRDGFAAAWYDTRNGNAEIYARALDGDGRNAGPELRLTTTPAQSYEADIAPLADAFAIAWYEKSADEALRAQIGVWARDGTPQWSTPLAVGMGYSRNPVVRSFQDRLFCAWIEQDLAGLEFVWGGWWGADGTPRGTPVRLGAAGDNTWNLNAAIAESGDAWVVFDAQAGTEAEELFLATLVDGQASLVQLTADDGVRSKYPDLALEGELGAITWFDERDGNREVYLAAAPAAELMGPVEPRARRVTDSHGASIGAYLAFNSDRIGLAWSDEIGGNYEIFFQPFDAVGAPLTPPRQITATPAHSMIPAIKAWRDGFALAWDEVVPAEQGAHDAATRSEIDFTLVDALD
jgi:hypothetical protein